ncbi:MAG: desulfoferrodoxin [Armatimonadetes bacterium]|nr:desulfoferrodoxin [Armatimonadota bacterium]
MAEPLEVYKCEKCGIIVEVINGGLGKLVCCAEPMQLQAENTVDAAVEKHVPVVEKLDSGIKVKVGSVAHPMVPEHFIEWIQVVSDGKVCHKQLKPGDEPAAEFACECGCGEVLVRAYCNLHGLWKA